MAMDQRPSESATVIDLITREKICPYCNVLPVGELHTNATCGSSSCVVECYGEDERESA